MSEFLDIQGFTSRSLGWKAWLLTLDLAQATAEQQAVLEESHPQAKISDYNLTLIHQPEVLRQRSLAFNAIMYAQRFEQLAKRNDAIAQVYADPHSAGTTPRERAIVQFAIALTLNPGQLRPELLQGLREQGLDDGEILDLIHATAIFAWANRLMLNLGEPVGL